MMKVRGWKRIVLLLLVFLLLISPISNINNIEVMAMTSNGISNMGKNYEFQEAKVAETVSQRDKKEQAAIEAPIIGEIGSLSMEGDEASSYRGISSDATGHGIGADGVTGAAITLEEDGLANNKYIADGFEAEICIDSQWNEGFNGRIKIKNTSDSVINNWVLKFDLANEITNIWNAAIVKKEAGTYLVKNAGWNQDIAVGQAIEFGFIAQGDEVTYPTYYEILVENYQREEAEDYGLSFKLNSDWGAGFTADMEIYNKSDAVIEDWILEFDFDKEITNIWNAVIMEHSGNHYVIKNASHNKSINPKAIMSFGFNGRDGNVKAEPYNYQLSQVGQTIIEEDKEDKDYETSTVPGNLLVASIIETTIEITWEHSVDNIGVEGYKIYRDNIEIGATTKAEYTFTDSSLEYGKEYRYTIRAYDRANNISDESQPLFVILEKEEIDTEPPTTPMNIRAGGVSGSAISLRWDASSDNVGLAGYIIYRDEERIATSREATYIDTLVEQGKSYAYYVKAYDEANNISEPSAMVYINLDDIESPNVPVNVRATIATGSAITLAWEGAFDNVGVVGYDIYMDRVLIASIDGFTSTFTITGLEPAREYSFYVRARDEAGNASDPSYTIFVRTILEAPSFIESTIKYNRIIISWSEVIGATEYELSINDDVINVGDTRTYIHTDLLSENKYEYKVRGIKGESEGAWSEVLELISEPIYDDWVVLDDVQLEGDMEVGNLTVEGRLSLNGHKLVVYGDANIKGVLSFDRGSLICKENFNAHTSPESYMEMSFSEDYLLVEGDYIQDGSYEQFVEAYHFYFFEQLKYKNEKLTLIDGTIELKGSFKLESTGMFLASNQHRLILSGESSQFIDIKGLFCHFANLEYKNISEKGILVNKYPSVENVKHNGCNINLTSEYQGMTLYEDLIIDGDFYLDGGTLDLNGYKLSINGNFIHTAGEVNINGGHLDIHKNYCMTSFQFKNNEVVCVEGSGLLIMNNSMDYVQIARDFMMDSNRWDKKDFTEGTVKVGNNLGRASEIILTPFESNYNHTFILGNSFIGFRNLVNTDILYTFANFESDSIFLYAPIRITNSYRIEKCFGALHLEGNVKQLTDLKMFFYSTSSQDIGGLFVDNGVLNLGKSTLNIYCTFEVNGKVDINKGVLNYYWENFNNDRVMIDYEIDVNQGELNVYYDTYIIGNIDVNKGNVYIPGIVHLYGNIDVNQGELFITNKAYVYGDLNPNKGILRCYGGIIYIKDYHLNKSKGTYAPTGNYSYKSTDMQVDYLDDSIDFTRYYNSQDNTNSVFGKGWSFNFEVELSDFSNFMKRVTLPDGSHEILNCINESYTTYTSTTSRSTMEKLPDNTFILTTKDQIKYLFNAEGQLAWIENKEGNRLTIQHGSNGKPSSITDYVGRTYRFTYQGGLLKEITDSQGRSVQYTYEDDQLIKATDPMGIETNYRYDDSGKLSSISNHNNDRIEAIKYIIEDGLTKVDYVIDIFGNKKSYTYTRINPADEAEGKTVITDSNGRTTSQWYDEVYNITYSTDAEGETISVEYDNRSNVVGEIKSLTDRNGNTTTYERDARGNITKEINPDNSYRQYTYDLRNNLIIERDENGKYTYYIYDPTETYLLKIVQPLNGTDTYSLAADQSKYAITSLSYYQYGEEGIDLKGLIKTSIDPEGNITTYTYDTYGNIESIIDSNKSISSYSHNLLGLPTTTISPKGDRTDYSYDNNGNLLTTKTNGGETRLIIYDSLGRKSQELSPNQYSQSPTKDIGYRYAYYSNGTLKSITDPENNTSTYTYDLYGSILTETKPNGSLTSYDYDKLGRVTKEYVQDNIASNKELLKSYTYTILSDGKTQSTETIYLNDTRTATTIYTYDYANRLIKQINPDGGTLTTSYNANGTIYSTTDANSKVSYYRYDGLNRPTEQWLPFDNNKYTYKAATYDKNSNKTTEKIGVEAVSLWALPATQLPTTYTYDTLNRVSTLSSPANDRTHYEYDANGSLSKETIYINDKETKITEYEYNHLGKATAMTQYIDAGDIYGHSLGDKAELALTTSYTYDANGNLTSMKTADGSLATYTYDRLDRQTSVTEGGLDEYGNHVNITITVTYDFAGNILTTTDPLGNTTENIYNQRGLLEATIDPLGGRTAHSYDRAGRLITRVMPENYIEGAPLNQMSRAVYSYDDMNRIILEQDIYLDTETNTFKTINAKAYMYDINGNTIKTLDALGYASGTGQTIEERISTGYGTINSYNHAGMLLTTRTPAIIDISNEANSIYYDVVNTYDAIGRRISEANAENLVTKYYYDGAGRQVKTTIIDKTEKILQEVTYDGLGNILTSTDGNGSTTTYTYNRLGLLRMQTNPGDESIASYTIENQYDSLGRLVYQKDTMDKVLLYTYNHKGQILSQTEKRADVSKDGSVDSVSIINTYDINGNLRFATDANGSVTEYTYDPLNRLHQRKITIGGIEQVTTNTYDKNNNLLTTTDWLGNTYTNEYDALNRLTKKIDPYGKAIEALEYNDNHSQISSYDALGNKTTYTYDKNNRLITTIDPEGHTTNQTYDKLGNIATKRDGKEKTTTFAYDALSRLSKVTNAKGETTSYTYDMNGNKLTQTDGKNNTITYTYNLANLLIKKQDPKALSDPAKTEVYTYNPNRTLKTRTDRNSSTTSYTYDIYGNLIKESIENGIRENDTITYTYDNNKNLITMTDKTGMTIRSYDELGRVLTKEVPNVGCIIYEYDIINTLDIIDLEGVELELEPGSSIEKSIDPNANVTHKLYDKAGRITKVIVGDEVTTYSYYDNGNRRSVIYNDGTKEEYTYYSNNQIKTLINKRPDDSIMDSYSYTYDDVGNQLTKYEVINGYEKGTTSYSYDSLNRLETVREPDGRLTSYTYDGAGNRETETIVEIEIDRAYDKTANTGNTITTVNTYTYNDQNRLTKITTKVDNVITELTDYSYDNNGNQLQTIVITYKNGSKESSIITATNTYDLRNQLTQTITADGIVNNSYNGEGYRTVKEVDGDRTYYLYEADKVILELDDTGKQKARNVYGTNLLMRKVNEEGSKAETYYYLYNGHADVTALITSDGVIAATYYYDAFGNILEISGDVNNSILYSGYQYDKETGLYYLNARMYDPKIARFLQEDTYTGQADDPLSLNLYTYCANSPIIYWDPTGHNLIKKYKEMKDEKAKKAFDKKVKYFDEYYKNLYGIKESDKKLGNEFNIEGTGKTNETYVTKSQLQQIYTNTTVTDDTITELNRVLEKHGITDIENIQHFLAQTCIETGYGRTVIEDGSDKYLNSKKYGKMYSGVGYIQMTWDYSYQAFATYMILDDYSDLKTSYKNPRNNDATTILKTYNSVVQEATNKGYTISKYTDIVDIGRDYVAKHYAWETAGYYWSTNGLTSADSSTSVDEVTTVVNKWTDSYEARRNAYNIVIQHIN